MTEHKNIHTALAAAQAEMGGVKKGSVNPAFKSKYADLADVVQAVCGALNSQGIAFYHVPATVDGSHVMRTVLAHGASGTQSAQAGQDLGLVDTQALPDLGIGPGGQGQALPHRLTGSTST